MRRAYCAGAVVGVFRVVRGVDSCFGGYDGGVGGYDGGMGGYGCGAGGDGRGGMMVVRNGGRRQWRRPVGMAGGANS